MNANVSIHHLNPLDQQSGHHTFSLKPVVAMTDTRHLMLFRCNGDSGNDNPLRQLFARNDDVVRPPAGARPLHQVPEVD